MLGYDRYKDNNSLMWDLIGLQWRYLASRDLTCLCFKSVIPRDSGIKILDLLNKIYLYC